MKLVRSIPMASFWENVRTSMTFDYVDGGVTTVPGLSGFPWRTLACNIVIHHDGVASRVPLEDRDALPLADGGAVFVPFGLRHLGENTALGPHISRWAHFRATLFGAVDLFELVPVCGVFPADAAARVGVLCEALARVPRDPHGLTDVTEGQRLGYALLGEIAEAFDLREPDEDSFKGFRRLAPVMRAMAQSLADPFTVDDLCTIAGLSPSRLHTLFQEVTGLSPMKYLQRQRLSRAQRLLAMTDTPIQTIALSVGYPDPFHFSRLFRRKVGISPTGFRDQSRKHG
jgi:AraC-like DNA-binding protein